MDLPAKIVAGRVAPEALAPGLPTQGIELRGALEELERRLILEALERTGGNRNQAAALLGMNRTTLVEKLKRLTGGRDSGA